MGRHSKWDLSSQRESEPDQCSLKESVRSWFQSIDTWHLPHKTMRSTVETASLRVANNGLTWFPSKIDRCRLRVRLVEPNAFLFPLLPAFPSNALSTDWRSFSDSELIFPLYRAILWMTLTACSSFPLPIRYFGLSYRRKAKNRTAQRTSISAPIVKRKYLHPLLKAPVQPGVVISQEYLPIRGHATCEIAETEHFSIWRGHTQGFRGVGRKPTKLKGQ